MEYFAMAHHTIESQLTSKDFVPLFLSNPNLTNLKLHFSNQTKDMLVAVHEYCPNVKRLDLNCCDFLDFVLVSNFLTRHGDIEQLNIAHNEYPYEDDRITFENKHGRKSVEMSLTGTLDGNDDTTAYTAAVRFFFRNQTGFYSVYLDWVEYDDLTASIIAENNP